LRISLNGTLEDRSTEDPLAGIDALVLGMEAPKVLGLNSFMEGLEYAATDDRVKGILLDQSAFAAGYGALQEFTKYLN